MLVERSQHRCDDRARAPRIVEVSLDERKALAERRHAPRGRVWRRAADRGDVGAGRRECQRSAWPSPVFAPVTTAVRRSRSE